jgi:aldose 1-epimerase
MSFQVTTHKHASRQGEILIYRLEGPDEVTAEVCPALGFNCFRWHAAGRELLFCDPHFFEDGRPTRSGIPVLFPFPNRIRDGRFSWGGKTYQLPLNDPAQKNAIHGFACRSPWRVADRGAAADSAWVTGEFQASVDAPEALSLWPADHRLRLTCRLFADRLQLEAVVENPDRVPLPFGLGYHPYLHLPEPRGGGAPDAEVVAPARAFWQLEDALPTGAVLPVDAARDLNAPRPYHNLQLDDVLTGLDLTPDPASAGLCGRGRVDEVSLYAASAFRELVVFTPPHRRAMCLEPYTCTTDAINLQQRGVDAGLLVLPPDGLWAATIDLVV